ncbi:MAG: acriflavin resistance protein [Candidatus Scalindua brodae]|uniref:Acriflavin resistance protein n=1 Tax=Candidatus Scalindua brodae TaxID=237368 RepID=A0A0B0EMM5_9BACT|nr:MAG: acriflavin resistance protein [Candidatus Scalindua brodae]
MNIPEFAVKRPITTLMIILSVLVIGWISLYRIPLLYIPEITGHSLRVNVPYKSSSPQEVEDLITLQVEDALGTVKHVETIESTSTDVSSEVSLEFKMGTDMDLATLEVRDKIEQIRNDLPDEVDNIRIFRFKSGDLPVVEFSISIQGEISELFDLVEDVITPKIQRINGVASVDVRGIEKKQLLIELDLNRLKAHNIDTYSLRKYLRTNNINVSAGDLIEGSTKYIVRVIGEFQNVNEVASLPVNRRGIKLSDVADIRYDYSDKDSYQRLNGRNAVKVRVMKSSDANMVAVARDIINTVNGIKVDPRMKRLEIYVYRDRSQAILERLKSLRNAGISGGVLVVAILFFFLRNVRSALIITAAIPISVLCTFCLMFLMRKFAGSEVTLNIISLTGLMLAVGMMVDPAVVVLENIFRHKQEKNLGLREAAILGSSEVGVAVIAATATTICVFIPLVFLSKSRMGVFMHDFGISICSALVSSLFVALTLIPLVASRFLYGTELSNSTAEHSNTIRKPESSLIRKLTIHYTRFVELTLRFRWITVVVAILIVVFAFYLYGKLETEVAGQGIYRESRLQVDVPRSYSIDDTKILFERLEGILRENKEELEIETVSSDFDRSEGTLSVYFVKQEVAKRPVSVLEKEMRSLFPVIPGVKYRKGFRRGGGGREISLEIKGRNINTLTRLSDDIKDRLASMADLSDIQTNLEKGKDEIVVSIDRDKVKRYGLTSERVAFGIAGSLGNRAVSKFKIEDEEVDIVLQLKEEDRQRLDQLKNLESENSEGKSVVLGRVVDFEQRRGPEAIERKDRKPIVIITAQYNSSGLKKIRDGIMGKMAGFNLPAGYEWNLGEGFRSFEREEAETRFGLILAIILIYIIMASLFESYIHPLAILLTIPFAFTGVAIAFYVLDIPLDSVSRLGLLLLCGLVVNNAIVLIDYVNRLRRGGMGKHDAIVKGGKDRMRPILMTSFTTILGLLPMVLPLFLPFLFGPFEGRGSIWAPVGWS